MELLKKRFEKEGIYHHTLKIEGGWVDDSNDIGGETKYGVTKKTAWLYKDDWHLFGWDGNMRTMPYEFAIHVLNKGFWNPLRLDDVHGLSKVVASKILDWSYNAGFLAPILALQEHLNAANRCQKDYADIVADGIIGSKTIAALKAYIDKRGKKGERLAIEYMCSKQTVNYRELTVKRELNETFYFGWLDRVSMERECFNNYFLM